MEITYGILFGQICLIFICLLNIFFFIEVISYCVAMFHRILLKNYIKLDMKKEIFPYNFDPVIKDLFVRIKNV